jgi:hypothetical protein
MMLAMSRRLVVWLVTLPLALVGSQAGHGLAYRLVTPSADARAHELSATGHAYLAYLPLALAVATVLVAFALVVEVGSVVAAQEGSQVRAQAWVFGLVAPAVFVCQEHFERLLHDGAFPWDAVMEPSFVVGILLQLPFAAAAYGVARLLLRAARSLGRLIARPVPARRQRTRGVWSVVRIAVPGLPALALGYGSRGPPA